MHSVTVAMESNRLVRNQL